jgi:hypothetical protein
MNDAMNDWDRDVIEFVQAGRVAAGEGRAARVRAALATQTDAPAPGRRPQRLFAAAVVLLGALVVAGVAWLRHTPGNVPAQEPQRQRQQAPPAAPAEPGDPNGAEPASADLAETLAAAPLVLVVDVFFPSGVPALDGLSGTVKHVLQGDAKLAGKKVWLHWNKTAAKGAQAGCLDQVDLASTSDLVANGGHGLPWLLALTPMSDAEKAAAGPPQYPTCDTAAVPWLHAPTAKGLPGTLATRAAVKATGDGKAQVLAWLAAGCKDADEGVRADSAQALAAAGELPPGLDVKALVADPLPQVRAAAAAFAPRDIVLQLAFDRSQFVRSAALGHLQGPDRPPWCDGLLAQVMLWSQLGSPREWRLWEGRVLQKAEAEHIQGYVGAFLRQLHQKTQPVNHMLGALGLGRSGDKQQLPELVALAAHEDASVRVAAAWSRVLLGDRQGHDLLAAMALADDPNTAIMALDAVRALDSVESFTTLAAATKSSLPVARALAAAGLREQRARGEHEVDALLAELQKDPEEIVRVAAASR